MDWNTREKVLGYFVDFVVDEIDEIENIISWADARNHPETAMNKIRQIVVARQEIAIYACDVLMEQTRLPDRWALAAAGAGTLQWRKKSKDQSKVGTSEPGESSRHAPQQQASTSAKKKKNSRKASKSKGSSYEDVTWPPLPSRFKGRVSGQGISFKPST